MLIQGLLLHWPEQQGRSVGWVQWTMVVEDRKDLLKVMEAEKGMNRVHNLLHYQGGSTRTATDTTPWDPGALANLRPVVRLQPNQTMDTLVGHRTQAHKEKNRGLRVKGHRKLWAPEGRTNSPVVE